MRSELSSLLKRAVGNSARVLEKFIDPPQTLSATRVMDVRTVTRPLLNPKFNANQTPESAAGTAHPQPPIQPVSDRFPALEEQEILLTLLAPDARKVNVAGNFNGWCPKTTPLKNTGAGEWAVRLMLRSGQYEYRFVVDGCWGEDPWASQRVANPHNGFNSVLTVPLEVTTSIL